MVKPNYVTVFVACGFEEFFTQIGPASSPLLNVPCISNSKRLALDSLPVMPVFAGSSVLSVKIRKPCSGVSVRSSF